MTYTGGMWDIISQQYLTLTLHCTKAVRRRKRQTRLHAICQYIIQLFQGAL